MVILFSFILAISMKKRMLTLGPGYIYIFDVFDIWTSSF